MSSWACQSWSLIACSWTFFCARSAVALPHLLAEIVGQHLQARHHGVEALGEEAELALAARLHARRQVAAATTWRMPVTSASTGASDAALEEER